MILTILNVVLPLNYAQVVLHKLVQLHLPAFCAPNAVRIIILAVQYAKVLVQIRHNGLRMSINSLYEVYLVFSFWGNYCTC
jgi:hypothetical protein